MRQKLLLRWLINAVALYVAAQLVPGIHTDGRWLALAASSRPAVDRTIPGPAQSLPVHRRGRCCRLVGVLVDPLRQHVRQHAQPIR